MDTLEFYEKWGVITPSVDVMYTVRDVIINSSGETGILLEEIVNPKVPIIHPLLGTANMEPNWNLQRFRMLNGELVSVIELKQSLKTPVNIKKL